MMTLILAILCLTRLCHLHKAFVASLQTVSIPKDWKAAKQDPKWRESMIEELEALKKTRHGC